MARFMSTTCFSALEYLTAAFCSLPEAPEGEAVEADPLEAWEPVAEASLPEVAVEVLEEAFLSWGASSSSSSSSPSTTPAVAVEAPLGLDVLEEKMELRNSEKGALDGAEVAGLDPESSVSFSSSSPSSDVFAGEDITNMGAVGSCFDMLKAVHQGTQWPLNLVRAWPFVEVCQFV